MKIVGASESTNSAKGIVVVSAFISGYALQCPTVARWVWAGAYAAAGIRVNFAHLPVYLSY